MRTPHLRAWSVGLLTITTLALAGRAQSQFAWTNVTPNPSPMGTRMFHSMAYDAARGVVVLFGGYLGTSKPPTNEVWEWNGLTWTNRTPPPTEAAPVPRAGAGIAYDSTRDLVIIFGGGNATSSALRDTWGWDGSQWHSLATTGPSPRLGAAMTFDSRRHRMVLFGGKTTTTIHSDTWEWDGSSWTQRSPMTIPPKRAEAGMAFDAARGRCVMFGGGSGGPTLNPGTWEWDGTDWSKASNCGPQPRYVFAMDYDNTLERTVMFGGACGAGCAISEIDEIMWSWDGSVWTPISRTTKPSPRRETAGAYDSTRRQFVVMGGWDLHNHLDDTWVFGGGWATLGPGCTNRTGPGPVLSGAGGKLGTDATATLSNGPGLGIGFFELGCELIPNSGILPIGCGGLRFVPSMWKPVLPNTATANWSVPIPNSPDYLFRTIYWQAIVQENLSGVSLSNYLVLVIR